MTKINFSSELNWLVAILLSLCIHTKLKAQDVFVIDDFSDKYYLSIKLDSIVDTDKTVALYFNIQDRYTQKLLYKSVTEWDKEYVIKELLNRDSKNIPYKEQKWFLYEDINFDGYKDFVLPRTYSVPFAFMNNQGYIFFIGNKQGKYVLNKSFSLKIRSKYPALINLDKQQSKLYLKQNNYQNLASYKAEYKVHNNDVAFIKSELQYKDRPYIQHTESPISKSNPEQKAIHYKTYNDTLESTEILLSLDIPEWGANLKLVQNTGSTFLMIENNKGQVEEIYTSFHLNKLENEVNLYFGEHMSQLKVSDENNFHLIWREEGKALEFNTSLINQNINLKDLASSQSPNVYTSYLIAPDKSPFYAQIFTYENTPKFNNKYANLIIIDNKTKNILLEKSLSPFNLPKNKNLTLTQELDYNQQNIFKVADFNFDDQVDLIVQFENLKTPEIYLYQEEKLTYSPEFSAILERNTQWSLVNDSLPGIKTKHLFKDEHSWEERESFYTVYENLPILLSKKGVYDKDLGYTGYYKEHRTNPKVGWQKEEELYLNIKDKDLSEFLSFSKLDKTIQASFYQYKNRLFFAIHDRNYKLLSIPYGNLGNKFIGRQNKDNLDLVFGQQEENNISITGNKLQIDLLKNEQKISWTKKIKKRKQKQFQKFLGENHLNLSFDKLRFEIPNSSYTVLIEDIKKSEVVRINIQDKKSGRNLIKHSLYADDIPKEILDINKLKLNDGIYSLIYFEDFNFDGKKDMAILNESINYRIAPSYTVYLATENGFEMSKEFSELAQDHYGMFKVNKEAKTLENYIVNWYYSQQNTYSIKDGIPYLIEQWTEESCSDKDNSITCSDYDDLIINGMNYHFKLIKDEWQKIPTRRLNMKHFTTEHGDLDENHIYLYFEFDDAKKLFLFEYRENIVYAYTTPDNKIIELSLDYEFPTKEKPYFYFKNKKNLVRKEQDFRVYSDYVEIYTKQDKEVRIPKKIQTTYWATRAFDNFD